MPSVYVVGSINDDIVVSADRCPGLGETVVGSSLQHFPGGKGANQAVAAARAGASTSMIGLVGDDSVGRQLVEFLKSSGVDTNSIATTSDAPTGTAIITIACGENTIAVVAGANGLLDETALVNFKPEPGDVVVAQYETPIKTTVAAFKKAKESHATTILNPAPAGDVNDELLNLIDYLVVNEHEYKMIFGAAPNIDTLATVAKERGFAGSIIVTLGADGLIALRDGQVHSLAGHEVDVVDSTGAGDCFVGYFAAGIAKGSTFEKSLERANLAAATSVTKLGAASSIPSYEI
ncbi:ribokinase [Candidatus Saccharibacteria bacterium]|nr:ribokinase [Candidatus Saccharibacteria bacterium]